ncbi:tRNA (adenosine(37)-N6)-threonylcarbamoyltransferase complex transferase subunit TsaD [Candidatus Dependentiae bacterium]
MKKNNTKKSSLILGIETSCDETSAAVYISKENVHGGDPGSILSNVTFSQVDLHKAFGGVVPEIASRSQLEKINPVVQEALEKANVTLDDTDTIAVACKPGLPGSLLVGVCFAKALAAAKNKKLIGVNHLEAHAYSSFLEYSVPFPHICLTASGGHTSLYLMHDFGKYEVIGQTADDAAGEAFDKIAKLMNLPYPGGPVIEKLASQVGFQDFFSYPRGKQKNLDFSFSGLKTAVLYDLVKRDAYDMASKTFLKEKDVELKRQVASSLLVCITDIFEQRLHAAHKFYPNINSISLVGGVACNKYLRGRIDLFCKKRNLQFFTPSPRFCTDNAAMIAFVGSYKAKRGEFSDLSLDIL